MIKIFQLKEAIKKDLADINRLLPQLSVESSAFSLSDLKNILSQPNLIFLVAKDSERIIGMGLLFLFQKAQGLNATIENVAVDETYRGRGIGKFLMNSLIDEARKKQVSHIDLTSKPQRAAANELYKKLGFEARDTNAYRLKLKA